MADREDIAGFLASRWRTLSAAGHPAVPGLERSLALAAKIALDEVLLTAMVLSVRLPSESERRRIGREVAAALELFADRGWLDHPHRYHQTPPVPERLRSRRVSARGLRFLHLSFDSGYEPRGEEPGRARWLRQHANRTAHAWVLRHDGRPRPWLVCIHGYGMGFPFVDFGGFQADLLHRGLGLNLLFPVLPLHGPRRSGRRSGAGFVAGDHLDTVHAEAQAMWDIRRLLAWVRAEDGEGVGAYGLSLGGYNAALLAGLEPDLACVIAGSPATCFVSFVREHAPLLRLRQRWAPDLVTDETERLMRVISPLSLTPIVPWERRYLFGGLADRFIPARQVHRLWEHWSRPRVVWYQGTHVTFPWDENVRRLVREALRASGLWAGLEGGSTSRRGRS